MELQETKVNGKQKRALVDSSVKEKKKILGEIGQLVVRGGYRIGFVIGSDQIGARKPLCERLKAMASHCIV